MITKRDNKFYTFVKISLIERGWGMKDLALKTGYPRRTVSAAINGRNLPYVIQAIATTLNHDSETNGPLPSRPARPEKRIRSAS